MPELRLLLWLFFLFWCPGLFLSLSYNILQQMLEVITLSNNTVL
jgi:hypothetical protein